MRYYKNNTGIYCVNTNKWWWVIYDDVIINDPYITVDPTGDITDDQIIGVELTLEEFENELIKFL